MAASESSIVDWSRRDRQDNADMIALQAGQTSTYEQLKIQGLSLSGIRTAFAMPELSICFDLAQGYPFAFPIKKYFISHGHMDHAGGLPYLLSQKAMTNQPVADFYMPESLISPMTEIIRLWEKIEQHEYQFRFHAVDANSVISINNKYEIRVFPTVHRIDSFGYALFENRTKRASQYSHLGQTQIADLARQGLQVTEKISKPVFAFTGDTQIDFLDQTAWLQDVEVMFLECTYLDSKKSIEHARKWGHTHLDEIIPRLPSLKAKHIVLIHISSRYTDQEIERILSEKIPADQRSRVTYFPGR